MRKLILLSIAAIFVNISVQAHSVFINDNNIANENLYNSIYSDFENYYKEEINKENSEEIEQDELYNDLYNAFESRYKIETAILQYQDESNNNLYSEISDNFNSLYTLSTVVEEYEDNLNNSLYQSIEYDISKQKSIYRNKKNVSLVVSIRQ